MWGKDVVLQLQLLSYFSSDCEGCRNQILQKEEPVIKSIQQEAAALFNC